MDTEQNEIANELRKVSLPGLTIINSPLRIVSHQTRPLAFELRFSGEVPTQIRLSIGYTTSSHDFVQAVEVVINLKHRSILEAQKFTFLHPSGTVSHALLRPPLNNTCRTSDERGFPLLLGLHGAGVELDGDLAQHMFDGVYGICAWIIIPSGVTSWSGDDWRACASLYPGTSTTEVH